MYMYIYIYTYVYMPALLAQVRVPGGPEQVSFEVPEGVAPGDQVIITAPSGKEVTVTVPEGGRGGPGAPGDDDMYICSYIDVRVCVCLFLSLYIYMCVCRR